jgi:predicted PhzF superfamily epimerase YddE/YHI9
MKIFQVDSFTNEPFKGNPAAVLICMEALPKTLMKSIAAEMNLSETAFLEPVEGNIFNLRWFTPTHEVTLCGHATLAAAHILCERELIDVEQDIEFLTLSGTLKVRKEGGWLHMDFPAIPTHEVDVPDTLSKAYPRKIISAAGSELDLILELKNEKAVKDFLPDFNIIEAIEYRGVIVTAKGQDGIDFVSRFFGPRVGVPEDPVTGSAHVLLGDFWMKKLGKSTFNAQQVSQRGGDLKVQMKGDRVLLSGQAITVMESNLLINQGNR